MVLIVKPISAQLTKDGDFFGKSVNNSYNEGSILCGYGGARKATHPKT